MKIRCLIPIGQEMRNENALRRACKICDEIHVLYIVDESLFERMERESAYVLNSDMLEVLRKTLVESQKEEAKSIIDGLKRDAELHFEVGDHFEVIDRYTLRLRPDLIMVDDFDRKLMGLKSALWVDRGNEIKRMIFAVSSVYQVSRLNRDMDFVKSICNALGCEMYLHALSGKKEDEEILRKMNKISHSSEADMVVFQKNSERTYRKYTFLILSGR